MTCISFALVNAIFIGLNIYTATKAMNNQTDPLTTISTTVKVGLCISSVLFLIAVVLVPAFKLHRLLVYRLALYQVISAKLCLIVLALLLFGQFNTALEISVKTAVGASTVFLKLVLTLWINFHLFILSVCHKNLKRLELFYVGSSIIVAAVIFIVTLELAENDTKSFYSNASANLNSNSTFDNPFYLHYEFIALLSVACFLLVISFLLVVIMVLTLCCRAIKGIGITSVNQQQHKKVLYEMMPLLAYPLLYLILVTPLLSYMVYTYIKPYYYDNEDDFSLYGVYGTPLSILLWSITCSCALIIHVSIVLCNTKRKAKRKNPIGCESREAVTINETTSLVGGSETHYSSPIED